MKKLILIVSLFSSIIFGQEEKSVLFPGDLLIQPFAANTLEPKMGFLFQVGKNELRLDVGNSMDIYRTESDGQLISIGADFFTYSLLRKQSDFHFPVDAIDYLFGLNFGYKVVKNNVEYGARLRLSHISAHFVDGHYNKDLGEWRDGLQPRVYSREFLELMPYYKFNQLRVYAGITYLYHVDPQDIGKDIYQVGFDYYAENFFNETFTPFAGYDLRIVNLYDYELNHSFVTGIKWGKPNGRGLSLYFQYYSGKSIHGELFLKKVDYSAIGINLDL